LGYKGNVIRDYFLNYYNYNSDFTVDLSERGNVNIHNHSNPEDWKITMVETGAESMTGYRVKLCTPYITGERFMLTYGDAVSNVDLAKLVEFNRKIDTIGTVTGVYPPSRFGDLVIEEDYVTLFKQQLKDLSSQTPINGGYFVFKKEFLDHIPNDPGCNLENQPIDAIVEMNQLSVYRHTDFWQCMDTFRDNQMLEKMWSNNPAWKVW
jgi:glucose-1-phosphate cytidylyltransferase